MGVKRETVDLRRAKVLKKEFFPESVHRQLSGAWSLVGTVAYEVELPDGRVLAFSRQVQIKTLQRGSLPRGVHSHKAQRKSRLPLQNASGRGKQKVSRP